MTHVLRTHVLASVKKLLSNRILVLWVLGGYQRENSEHDQVARFVHRYVNLQPMLERVSQGIFPTDEELTKLLPDSYNDLFIDGICHVLGNMSPAIPKLLK